jgi:hypothetical protein
VHIVYTGTKENHCTPAVLRLQQSCQNLIGLKYQLDEGRHIVRYEICVKIMHHFAFAISFSALCGNIQFMLLYII